MHGNMFDGYYSRNKTTKSHILPIVPSGSYSLYQNLCSSTRIRSDACLSTNTATETSEAVFIEATK